jgi:hypothetical protein
LTGKLLYVGGMPAQQPSHIFSSAIAYAQPDNLWWRSAQNAQPVLVFILRDERAPSFLCQPPQESASFVVLARPHTPSTRGCHQG